MERSFSWGDSYESVFYICRTEWIGEEEEEKERGEDSSDNI